MSRGSYISFTSNSNHSIANVVRSGGGIGIMVHDETRDTDLVRLKNITMKPQMTFYLVAHRLTKDIPKILRCFRILPQSSAERQILISFRDKSAAEQ